jgi:hypothetical protein
MTANVKWLVRAGALLVIFGFFLPTMMVSCSVMGMTQPVGELSLASLANGTQFSPGDGALYLILIGMLVALVGSFVSFFHQGWEAYMPLVEAGGIALSVLILVVKLIQISSNTAQSGIQVVPLYGAVILFIGYVLAIGGVVLEFVFGSPVANLSRGNGRVIIPADREPEWQSPPPQAFPPPGPVALARLEMVSGNLPVPMVQVSGTDFTIGRGSTNQLNIPDRKVSRAHARLRYAQGTWFVQDQNSAIGTYVNGQRVQAGRLNSGDQLKIGDTTFIFRC